ncbi:phospholipase [Marivirga tractuosa]|uniref:Phospholipase/Carboxylesterase n=2 Tax=Marivirga TaxID=869806 RepID=E4TS48_MARTH|nr:phospholipase/Carboxylesterase [Marivirga tractuosa DSM 4126]BDD13754.1 phospholipase [Marivirga tractuosa]
MGFLNWDFTMKNKLKFCIGFLLTVFTLNLYAQDKSEFLKATLIEDEDTLSYRILYPKNFNPAEKYPLVLFLHGAGERGGDNEKQLVHGSSLFLNQENRENFPAVVIFPQCPSSEYWAKADIVRSTEGNTFRFDYSGTPNKSLGLVMKLLDQYSQNHFIDQNRLYVGGLSMGGMGTFEILSRMPNTFAAAIAICGAGNPYSVGNYADKTDLWVFHGAKDDVVDPEYSKEMVKSLKAAGANVKFTLYPEANHNSWDPAFAEPELLTWLFSNSK